MNSDFDDAMSIDIDSDDELFHNPYENYVFADVQGFKLSKNRFICKEFCLLDGNDTYYAIIKSPFKYEKLSSHYRRQADWLTKNHHGLLFDCGSMNIVEMKQNVFPKVWNKTFLVKGQEKVTWMRYIFRDCGEINCMNVEDLNFDRNFKPDSNDICENHIECSSKKQYVCAKLNALLLQSWAKENPHSLF